jgi:transcription elongation GreA/GreB family factor
MNVRQLLNAISNKQSRTVESAWIEAMDKPLAPAAARKILDALVEAGMTDLAVTLASLALEEQRAQLDDARMLALCKEMLLAVPDQEELRATVAELYKSVHGGHPHFDAYFRAAGLTTGQSPRRALRTLDTCLALEEGMYLANRFDPRVIRFAGFDEVMEEIEFTEDGAETSMEPKLLADEFEILSPQDFRVLRLAEPEKLKEIVKSDPHRVLVGICLASGGETTNEDIRDMLTDGLLAGGQWSRWWSRARNAIKKSDKLTLEGRSPVTITYHPEGRTLQEDLASDLDAARTPQALLDVMRTYAREAQTRSVEIDPEFAGRITEQIASRGTSLLAHRPADALVASLALAEAMGLGAAEPETHLPPPAEVIQLVKDPAQAILQIEDLNLWPRALEALRVREDAATWARKLLAKAPASQIDQLARLVQDVGDSEALAEAANNALTSPDTYAEMCCWMWNQDPESLPVDVSRVELLGRMLAATLNLEHDMDLPRELKKQRLSQIRNALSARDYAMYRQALDEMDQGTAAVIKRRVDRADGLAQAVHDEMLSILRQHHPRLFLKETIDPWLDDSVIYTTAEAMNKHQEELRVLQEEDMPANAKQIGEAAAQGDLRENADWTAAIEERDMLQARANKIQAELAKCRIISADDVPSDRVAIGSKVRLVRADNGETLEYTFLGPWDSNLEENVLAYTTPLGQSLMGVRVGQTAEVPMQDGTVACRVEAVEPGL